jgi:hypothetical protein
VWLEGPQSVAVIAVGEGLWSAERARAVEQPLPVTLCYAAGVSVEREWDMNSLCVPRVAKEAIGAICALRARDGTCMTINVEYNQLDPLLRNTIQAFGAAPATCMLRMLHARCHLLGNSHSHRSCCLPAHQQPLQPLCEAPCTGGAWRVMPWWLQGT